MLFLSLPFSPFKKVTRLPGYLALAVVFFGATLRGANVSSEWIVGDGLWETAAKWTNVPGVSQYPNNGNGGFTYDVALASGGTATLSTNVTVQKFTITTGVLAGNGQLTINEVFSWTGGFLTGSNAINANGGMQINIAGIGGVLSQRTLNLAAGQTTTWSGTGNLSLGSGAVINNAGIFDIQSDQMMGFNNLGAQTTFNNTGTLKKTGGTGTTLIGVGFTNTGTVDAQSGTLSFGGGGTSSGSIIGAGAVGFDGQTMAITGSYNVTGETLISSGTVNFNTAAATTMGKLTVAGGTLGGAATINVGGSLVWTGGLLTGSNAINANGGMQINIAGIGGVLSQRTLNLAAGQTTTWTGTGNLSLGSGAVINNAGIFDIQSDQMVGFNNVGAQTTFNNTGTLKKTVGTGTTVIGVGFTNTGTVDAQSGTLTFSGGGTSSGSIIGAGAVGFDGQTMAITGSYNVTGETLISSGTVNFNTAAATTMGKLTVAGGALGGSATINVAGPLVWTGGNLTGANAINANGGMQININAGGGVLSQRPLNLAAGQTTTWSGTGNLSLGSGAIINNAGIFDILGNRSILRTGLSQATFNNTGTLKKTGGTGTTIIGVGFTNTGMVDAQSGTLTFSGGGTSSGSIIGAGTVGFDGQTMAITGIYNMTGETLLSSGEVNFNTTAATAMGKLTVAGGTLGGTATINVTGPLVWTGGNLTGANAINANGGMQINIEAFGGVLSQRTLNLAAGQTTTWSGAGDLSLDASAAINNAGIFDIRNDRSLLVDFFSNSVFNNTGVLTKSAGAGITNITSLVQSSGDIHPESGLLNFSGGGSISGNVAGAGGMGFSAGNMALTGSYAIGGETRISGGTVHFDTVGPTVTGALTLTGGSLTGLTDLDVNGLFVWEGGSISSATALNAKGGMLINLTVGGTGLTQRTLNLAAGNTTIWTGAESFFLDTGATINNAGVFDIRNDQTISQSGGTQSAFNNTGTLLKSDGVLTSTIGVAFSNPGTVRVESGTLLINAVVAQSAGSTLTGGVWEVGAGATLSLPTVANIVTNQADVRLSGADSVFANVDTIANNQGAFHIKGGREFQTVGALTNSGVVGVDGVDTKLLVNGTYVQSAGTTDLGIGGATFSATSISIQGGSLVGSGTVHGTTTIAGIFSPGHSAGAIVVEGNFSLTASAQSLFEIGGVISGADYDVLMQATGMSLTLDGTLNLSLTNGFENQITAEDMFVIVTAANGGLTGSFSNVADGARLDVANGLGSFVVNYSGNGVVLSNFAAVPEPSSIALLILGGAMAGGLIWRSRSGKRPTGAS